MSQPRAIPILRRAALAAACALAVLAAAARPAASAPRSVAVETAHEPGTIVIRTGERRLYLTIGPGEALAYDIAVGKPSDQWFGKRWVSKKRPAPTWVPTPSMRRANPSLPRSIAPGPDNPLGERAINLGWGAYRIHGTNKPWSIGRAASSGCFRMKNADVKDLYERVHVGATVFVRH